MGESYLPIFTELSSMTDLLAKISTGVEPDNLEETISAMCKQYNIPACKFQDLLSVVGRDQSAVPANVLSAIESYRHNKRQMRSHIKTAKHNLSQPPSLDILRAKGVNIIYVDLKPPKIKIKRWLYDKGNEDLIKPGSYVVVPDDEDWHIVHPNESVVFVEKNTMVIKLVVLRGICAMYPEILDYINQIILEAIKDRHNVQPTHPGSMVQFGQNAGLRHLSIFGYVRNIKHQKMPETDRTRKDHNLLGIFAIVWNLLRVHLPAPTIEACEVAMDEAGIPRMGTEDNPSDAGYTINTDSGPITFSTSIRAPCEGPLHTDKSYTDYSFSLSTLCTSEHATLPPGGLGGGNYVDANLRVIVHMSLDTAMVTVPLHNHGTTVSQPGVKCLGVAHSWSTHILKAFERANTIATETADSLVDVNWVKDM